MNDKLEEGKKHNKCLFTSISNNLFLIFFISDIIFFMVNDSSALSYTIENIFEPDVDIQFIFPGKIMIAESFIILVYKENLCREYS